MTEKRLKALDLTNSDLRKVIAYATLTKERCHNLIVDCVRDKAYQSTKEFNQRQRDVEVMRRNLIEMTRRINELDM